MKAFASIICILVASTVGTVKARRHSMDDPSTTTTSCPALSHPCMNLWNLAKCKALKRMGCLNLRLEAKMCPYRFVCAAKTAVPLLRSTVPPTPAPTASDLTWVGHSTPFSVPSTGASDICPSITDTCMSIKGYANCMDLVQHGCTKIGGTSKDCPISRFACDHGTCPTLRNDACMTRQNLAQCRAVMNKGCQNPVPLGDACPYVGFGCNDDDEK